MKLVENRKNRVLHLITGLEKGGGAEANILKIIPKLKNTENRICVLKGRGQIAFDLENLGVRVYFLDMKSALSVGGIFAYKKVLKDFSPDIQVNYLIHADIFGRIFGRLFSSVKIISYIRNRHEEKLFFWSDRMTAFLVDFFLTNSNAVRSFYINKHKISADRIRMIPNSVDIKEIEKRSNEIANFSFEPKLKYIISVARLHNQKDLGTLIRSMQKVLDKFPNTKLIICGEGPEKNKLESLVTNLNLSKDIKFLGRVDNPTTLMKRSDLFILPSKFEGMSNSLLEAMTIELPVIVSDILENLELISDTVNGTTFPVGDPDVLGDRIISVLDDQLNAERKSKNARETILSRYDSDIVAKMFDEFLSNFYDRK